MDEKERHNRICHTVRNGLLVIRGLCWQGELGKLEIKDVLKKIRERTVAMEKELPAN